MKLVLLAALGCLLLSTTAFKERMHSPGRLQTKTYNTVETEDRYIQLPHLQMMQEEDARKSLC